LTAAQLFQLAILSKRLYCIVANYLEHLRHTGEDEDHAMTDDDCDISEEEDGGVVGCIDDDLEPEGTLLELPLERCQRLFSGERSAIESLPIEVTQQILCESAPMDRLRYGQASKGTAAAVSFDLQTQATAILTPFDLRFAEVRLLLTATHSLISGSTIAALASATSFSPNDLDFYCPHGSGYNVGRFLTKGGNYKVTKFSQTYDFAAGMGRVWTLRHRRSKKKKKMLSNRPPKVPSTRYCISTSPASSEPGRPPVFGSGIGDLQWPVSL
jgi:hypothetical protein